ncbi:MAG: hypothetical protein R2711_01200 [Acidimicrobiales bacterium]
MLDAIHRCAPPASTATTGAQVQGERSAIHTSVAPRMCRATSAGGTP